MSERPTYTVMIENPRDGKFLSASHQYVQRASAFKRAQRIAKYNRGHRVRVWEYAGPGNSTFHEIS